MKIAVLGAGAWGTALAASFSSRHTVALWARDAALVAQIAATRINDRYLPSIALSTAVAVTDELPVALHQAELALVATPVAGLREILQELERRAPAVPVLWACKGFEKPSARLPHEIVREAHPSARACGTLSGPSFAEEVAQGLPTAITLASADATFATELARTLNSSRLRLYSTGDLVGVELAGALKNVIAIAAGICDGLALGMNARAALITRGLSEIARLGAAMGARQETFMGLAGLGDLVLTATGHLSRNRKVGMELAAGKTLSTILAALGHVAEGVHTAASARALANKRGVDMPITAVVCDVLEGQITPREAVESLLARDPKAE